MDSSYAGGVSRRIRPWVAGWCALALLSFSAWAGASAPTYRFHIEGQPLNQALQVFSDQSGLQIVYHTELLPDTATRRVDGTYDAQTALNRLLRGTGLVAMCGSVR